MDQTLAASVDDWPLRSAPLSPSVEALDSLFRNALFETLDNRDSASENEKRVLYGLAVSSGLRTGTDMNPVVTERAQLWGNEACAIDLVMDRFVPRYAQALNSGQEHELALIVLEFQNALNCLSARQNRDFAQMFGHVLLRLERDIAPTAQERMAVFNFALLMLDQTKFVGRTSLYHWILSHGSKTLDEYRRAGLPLYLYDYISGHLIGLEGDVKDEIDLGNWLNPVAIGQGACSFLEMEASGRKTGNYGCGRNLGCQFAVKEEGGLSLPGRAPTLSGGAVGGLSGGIDLSLMTRTPYGVTTADARSSNCHGVGGGAGDAGLGGFAANDAAPGALAAPGAFGDSWQGCIMAAMITNHYANDYGYCVLGTVERSETSFFGAGFITDAGNLRAFGASGGESCSNPLADDGDTNPSRGTKINANDGSMEDNEKALTEAKKDVDDAFDNPDVQADLIAAANALVEDLVINLKANGMDPDLADKLGRTVADDIRRNPNKYLNSARAAAAGTIDQAGAGAKTGHAVGGNYGETGQAEDGESHISVDTDKHDDAAQLAATIMHEAIHALQNKISHEMWKHTPGAANEAILEAAESNWGAHHIINHYDAAFTSGLGEWFQQRHPTYTGSSYKTVFKCGTDLACHGEQKQLEKLTGTQLPKGPAACGAHQAALAKSMNCNFNGAGLVSPDSGGTDPVAGGAPGAGAASATPVPENPGTIDPSLEQWTNRHAGALSSCFARYGIGSVGVDQNGYAKAGLNNPSSSTGCGAMQCPAGGTAVSVGGGCACSGRNDQLARPFGAGELCFSSDLCLPGKPEVFIVDIDAPTDARPRPTLPPELLDGLIISTPSSLH